MLQAAAASMELRPPPVVLYTAAEGPLVGIRLGESRAHIRVRPGDSQANRRGRARLEWLWPRIDHRAESVGESVSRAVIEWCGFPEAVLQQRFHYEGADDRCDLYFPQQRVIGESDGYGKYLTAAGAADPAALVREKKREDRLRRHEHGFARWDNGDAMRAVPLRAKLMSAGVPLVRPANNALLATLRSHPRSR